MVNFVVEEVPDQYKGPEPEKPKLRPGSWVIIKDPRSEMTSPWAMVMEYLTTITQPNQMTGEKVPRHKYELMGVEYGEGDYLGDWRDDSFEIAKKAPPPDIKMKVEEAMRAWGREPAAAAPRVASRWMK